MHGRAARRAQWCAVLACALGVTPALAGTAAPAAPATAAAGAVPPPAPGHGNVTQSVRGDHVRIEGKLYSPQALFVVSRRTEAFGRDAVVPNYLTVQPDAAFLPYRLRAAATTTTAPVPAPDAATARSSDTRH